MKMLMVEGVDDKFVVEKLLKRRKIEFDSLTIQACNGCDNLLKILPGTINTRVYGDVIGVVVDADENVNKRWRSLQSILKSAGYNNIPQQLSEKGLILKDENYELPDTGLWIMPNNSLAGELEDFIRFLVPNDDALLPVAEKAVNTLIAEQKNRFVESDRAKALIHTWLAWQERPGKNLGSAITYKVANKHILDDRNAGYFLDWLKHLFR